MNIALVDDLEMELSRITEMINEYATSQNMSIDLKTFQNGEDFIKDYRPLQYTLVFMDIYMDGMTGIETVKKLREVDNDTIIVFLTTSTEHSFDAFDVHAFQYILKSPDGDVLKKSLYRVLDEIVAMQNPKGYSLLISEDGEEISIPYADILFVQSSKNYVQIVNKNDGVHRIRRTFSEIQSILEKDGRFLLINRGILINMEYITLFEKGDCVIKDSYHLPVKVREFKRLSQIRKNYIFSKLHSKGKVGGMG